MKKIIVYSTGCPLCIALEKMLDAKHIDYEKNGDIDLMMSKGFYHVPMVEILDEETKEKTTYNYKEAREYFGGR